MSNEFTNLYNLLNKNDIIILKQKLINNVKIMIRKITQRARQDSRKDKIIVRLN